MNRAERLRAAGGWAAALVLASAAHADPVADPARYRYRAAITVSAPGPFVLLPLPASAYARTAQPDLRDLLLVDANNQRVPFALLAPRAAEVLSTELRRDATLYPLPPQPSATGQWVAPVEVTVQGDRLVVKRLGGITPTDTQAPPGGWLIDLGERKNDAPAAQSVRLAWSGPAEFSAAYRLDTSDDLRSWRAAGSGQLLAFHPASPAGAALTQPLVLLPADAGRFVRLVWADPASAPAISAAQAIAAQPRSQQLDAPTELVVNASPAPAGQAADPGAAPALTYDLGATLPLVQVNLRLPAGTRVVPARLQGRVREADPWQPLASGVFYRLERDGQPSVSPPLALQASVRHLRLLPDPRAAALDPSQTPLVVQAALAQLVFVSQGQPPYALLAGAGQAAPAALPVASLVPALDHERARFGRASVGVWDERADVARAVAQQQQRAALRPWLLWAVLLAGVAALAFMVWRLAQPARPSRPPE